MQYNVRASLSAPVRDLDGSPEDYLRTFESMGRGYISRYLEDGGNLIAPILHLDCDTGEDSLPAIIAAMTESGLGCRVFFSGGKGYHVHIPLTGPVAGKPADVVRSMRKAGQALLSFADPMAFTRGIISVPGNSHPKTGVAKHLVWEQQGPALEVPLIRVEETEAGTRKLHEVLLEIGILYHDGGPDEGGRNHAVWQMAKRLQETGLDVTAAMRIMLTLNAGAKRPLGPEEVLSCVRSAYR